MENIESSKIPSRVRPSKCFTSNAGLGVGKIDINSQSRYISKASGITGPYYRTYEQATDARLSQCLEMEDPHIAGLYRSSEG